MFKFIIKIWQQIQHCNLQIHKVLSDRPPNCNANCLPFKLFSHKLHLMNGAVEDSCVSTEIGNLLIFCTTTFCHSCMDQTQLAWIILSDTFFMLLCNVHLTSGMYSENECKGSLICPPPQLMFYFSFWSKYKQNNEEFWARSSFWIRQRISTYRVKGRYHCTADFLFHLFEFSRFAYVN